MHRTATIALLLVVGLPRIGAGQQNVPFVSLTAGVGNAFGGVGLRGEVLVAQGRIGLLAGGGILPGSYDLDSPILGAVSLRYYVGRERHRLFADASLSALTVYDLLLPGEPAIVDYGPGFSLGYTYLSKAGLTLTVGGGVGLTDNSAVPIVQLGFGWTWRKPRSDPLLLRCPAFSPRPYPHSTFHLTPCPPHHHAERGTRGEGDVREGHACL